MSGRVRGGLRRWNQPNKFTAPIHFQGFNRVLVTKEGEATSPRRAIEEFHVTPYIGFLRDDGWSLGAPQDLEQIAFNMWEDKWTHFIMFGDAEYQPIELYEG